MSGASNKPAERQLGKYRLLDRLGAGGMGVVFAAEDVTLGRRVAVKLLPRELAANPESLRRFEIEARAAARLNHPHVVQIFEVNLTGDAPYLVMELLEGGSVAELLRRGGALGWREATRIIADACRGLAAAHDAGLLHRDLKPSNVLLSTAGVAKLADFGVAKCDETSRTLTPKGNIVGTPEYMSPEQCRAETLDARSDLYALGATYYALLTGRPPYDADTPIQIMFAHCSSPAPDARSINQQIPAACALLATRMMAKQKTQRPATATELLASLEALLGGPATPIAPDTFHEEVQNPFAKTVRLEPVPLTSTRSRRRWLVGAGVGSALVLGGIGWHLMTRKNGDDKDDKRKPDERKPDDRISDRRPIRPQPTTLLPGHIGDILRMVPSPDGKILATAGADTSIRLLQLPDGKYLRTLEGHSDKVYALAFSRDGKRLYSGGDDQRIHVWDPLTGKESLPREPLNHAYDLSFSADGKVLAHARGYAGVRIWHVTEDGRLVRPNEHKLKELCVAAAFDPEGKRLAVIDLPRNVRLMRAPDPAKIIEFSQFAQLNQDPTRAARYLAWSPDGDAVALASMSGLVTLWIPGQENSEALTDEHMEATRALAWTPDGSTLAFGGRLDGSLYVWHRPTRSLVPLRGSLTRSAITALAFVNEGRQLFTGHANGNTQIWDVEHLADRS